MDRNYCYWKGVFDFVLNESPHKKFPDAWGENFDPDKAALALAAKELEQKQIRQNTCKEYMKQTASAILKTQLITIMIDKEVDESNAIHIQLEIIDKLKEANYKFLSDVSHRFEYFTQEGWNPHIHILTLKNISDGRGAQQIRRKLMESKNKIDEVYRVHFSTLNYERHSKYINGEKCELKAEYLAKDAEFRKKHNINDIYYW